MNKVVVEAQAIFIENKVSQNNNEYFSSYWCFPQECMGQIFQPEQQKRKAKTRILGNTNEDGQLLSCQPGKKYNLAVSIGISPAKNNYPAQLNLQIVDIKAAA